MLKEQLFVVSKIETLKDKKIKQRWGTQKVFLFHRMLERGEKHFFSDVISSKALRGSKAWNFEVGDVVGAIPNGSIEPRPGEVLNFWLPIAVYPGVKNLILTDSFNDDKYRVAKDGNLLDPSPLAARAKEGEEWECVVDKIYNNKIIWHPWRRVSEVKAELKMVDGELMYCVTQVSGDKDVSVTEIIKPIIDVDALQTDDDEIVVRERYFFPIHRWDTVETKSSILKTSEAPGFSGSLIIDKKLSTQVPTIAPTNGVVADLFGNIVDPPEMVGCLIIEKMEKNDEYNEDHPLHFANYINVRESDIVLQADA